MPDLYLDDATVNGLCEEALAGDDVIVPGQLLHELTLDWRNMRDELGADAPC